MGPRLAPLALLLLALCGISSSAVTQPTLPTIGNADIGKNYKKGLVKYGSLFSAALVPGLAGEEKKVVDNGVLCSFQDTALAASIKTTLYEAKAPDTTVENDIAKAMKIITTANCNSEPVAAQNSDEYKCFCTTKNVALYCAAEKYKKTSIPTSTKPTSCPKEELAKIKPISDVLADYLDIALLVDDDTKMQAAKKLASEAEVDKLSTDATAKFFCAAIEPTVVTSVEAMTPADVIYFGTVAEAHARHDVTGGTCKDDAKKKTWFGECMCANNKMEQFCIFHAQAQYFKEEGYLSCCKGKEEFITAKKPTVKFGKDNAKKTPPVETPACAAPPPPAPATNETTTPSGSTTTTFSLLAPTTALLAAAALLRH